MREKLNSSPMAQIGLVAILVVAAFVLLTKSGGGEASEEAAPTEATVSVAGTSATGTATAATPGEAVEGAVEGALEAAPEASAAAAAASIPPPPLPAPVAAAYDSGKTVVLLVVHDGGIDDRLVSGSAGGLAALPEVALFVVPAQRIAHYAAITLGADVQQVPALVVMRPQRLSNGVPQASVDYGFQTPQSIVQAVRDASYQGPEATYHPN
jgi:hypothetical protein